MGSPFLDSVLQKDVPKNEGDTIALDWIDFSSVLQALAGAGKRYSYSGSLTTPPCTKGVEWTVADYRFPISVSQKKRLLQALKFNARFTMPAA